jgi:hypothetical protein
MDSYLEYGKQCCESGSGFERIRIRFGQLHPDPHWENGSGDPGGPKLPIKVKKVQVLKCQMFYF